MNTPVALRPLAMGEIIDRSALYWRSHFRALFALQLAFRLPQYVLSKLNLLLVYRSFPEFAGGARMLAALTHPDAAAISRMLQGTALFGVLIFTAHYIGWQSQFATSSFVGGEMLGRPTTVAEALSRTGARVGSTTASFVISMLMWAGFLLLACVPSAAVMGVGAVLVGKVPFVGWGLLILGYLALILFLIGVFLYGIVRFMLVPTVQAVEAGSIWAAIRRAGGLVSGRVGPAFTDWLWLRATIIITLIGVILFVVSMVTELPALLIQNAYGKIFSSHANLSAVPQTLLVPAELLQVLAQSVFIPIANVVAVVFYLDVRVRREGLDLELALKT